jgi:hypothetical protein
MREVVASGAQTGISRDEAFLDFPYFRQVVASLARRQVVLDPPLVHRDLFRELLPSSAVDAADGQKDGLYRSSRRHNGQPIVVLLGGNDPAGSGGVTYEEMITRFSEISDDAVAAYLYLLRELTRSIGADGTMETVVLQTAGDGTVYLSADQEAIERLFTAGTARPEPGYWTRLVTGYYR